SGSGTAGGAVETAGRARGSRVHTPWPDDGGHFPQFMKYTVHMYSIAVGLALVQSAAGPVGRLEINPEIRHHGGIFCDKRLQKACKKQQMRFKCC
ncbi:MAG: hypothetical protein RJQ10_04910, partial [Haliea sp.]|uniref:hypothetical protein n=1 Tax=Haliea sp. TaxID=1932666 RepID=UPI0032ED337D